MRPAGEKAIDFNILLISSSIADTGEIQAQSLPTAEHQSPTLIGHTF